MRPFLPACAALLAAACSRKPELPAAPPLVDADFVRNHRDAIVLVDMQSERALYEKGHVPGAVHADLEDFRVQKNYLAPRKDLEERLGALGIDRETHVVVYDELYGRNAGWLWFVLTQLGHTRVSLLDGHMDAFRDELETGPGTTPRPKRYESRRAPPDLVDADEVAARSKDAVLIDARPEEQYTGEKPKKGIRPGHIPGAINVPWESFRGPDRRYLTAEEAAPILERIPRDRELILYCHTYHMASHVHFQLARFGYTNVKAFDGSIEEWQQDASRPLVLGRNP